MDKIRKKDKTVTVSKSGKIKLELNQVQFSEFTELLSQVLNHVAAYTWHNRQLNLISADAHAGLALIHRLYTELPNQPFVGSQKIQFTHTEAIVLWATVKRAESEMKFSYPVAMVAIDKLHQKLS